jgi:hypothetical protein
MGAAGPRAGNTRAENTREEVSVKEAAPHITKTAGTDEAREAKEAGVAKAASRR